MANEKRLISLDEAIAKVKDDGILGEGYSDDERIDDVCDILESCEIVDAVEVVHGRWDDGECTACGFDIRDLIDGESDFRNWVWDGLPYCPNCGAKMDLE